MNRAFLLLICLFLSSAVFAKLDRFIDMPGYHYEWYTSHTLTDSILTIESVNGIKLIGTENGVYVGELVHLDQITNYRAGEGGYPDALWHFSPVYTTGANGFEPFLSGAHSVTIQDSVRVWAATDSGLAYADVSNWKFGILEVEWKLDPYFYGKVDQVVNFDTTLLAIRQGKLYKKIDVVGLEKSWSQLELPLSEVENQPYVTKVKVFGDTIFAIAYSDVASIQTMHDIFRSIDGGDTWETMYTLQINVTDFIQYKQSFDDPIFDFAFASYDLFSNETIIHFFPDNGLDMGILPVKVEDTIPGSVHTLASSYVSNSDIPKFYAAGSEGIYRADSDMLFAPDTGISGPVQAFSVDANEETNMLAAQDSLVMMFGLVYYYESVVEDGDLPRGSLYSYENGVIQLELTAPMEFTLYSVSGQRLLHKRLEKGLNAVQVSDMSQSLFIGELKHTQGSSIFKIMK